MNSQPIRLSTNFHDLYTELDLHRIMSGFHGAFATGVPSQQGTLTLPDTWFSPCLLGICLCSNCWNHFTELAVFFSRLFTLSAPPFFFDLASCSKDNGKRTSFIDIKSKKSKLFLTEYRYVSESQILPTLFNDKGWWLKDTQNSKERFRWRSITDAFR